MIGITHIQLTMEANQIWALESLFISMLFVLVRFGKQSYLKFCSANRVMCLQSSIQRQACKAINGQYRTKEMGSIGKPVN